jgi:hypothetical protein
MGRGRNIAETWAAHAAGDFGLIHPGFLNRLATMLQLKTFPVQFASPSGVLQASGKPDGNLA